MSGTEPAVRVTLGDIYKVVQQTSVDVAEIKSNVSAERERGDDHETRLRLVERRVWQLPSAATVCSLLAGICAVLSLIHSYGK